MTWALAKRIAGLSPSSNDMLCSVGCHATGEPGTHDGGFLDVAAELREPTPFEPSPFEHVHDIGDLPRPLRRLGSVGCLACHGPGALPEADARWSILRTDVCAYCHDAPPRYGHVEGWRASAMARADRGQETGSRSTCVGCHTTWGFLERVGGSREAAARRPPDQGRAIGIALGPLPHADASPD